MTTFYRRLLCIVVIYSHIDIFSYRNTFIIDIYQTVTMHHNKKQLLYTVILDSYVITYICSYYIPLKVCVRVCIMVCVPLQDLSNKDMKRDLYIVSQVIRTGEAPPLTLLPSHFPPTPHTHTSGHW